MLSFIKGIHTLIWIVMTAANCIAFYFAYMGNFGIWFLIPATLLAFESIVIITNHWKCPVTTIAERYTESRKPNFDIYLPEWLAKYNVRIFSILIPLEALIVLGRVIQ